jgi:uncharacterized protein CbrC (UPF0167 family)
MDFSELPVDGQAFEQLVRELLFSLGLHVQWSGRGADGGRDLICRETLTGVFTPQSKTWLVQCKHKAHGGGSVGVNDLDQIVDSCQQHGASGYLLVCSTQPSSAVINRIEAITSSNANNIEALYWDAVTLERLLSTSGQWAIAQRFMPKSCGNWKLYATEAPNDFIAHYNGYVFHLSNRIGSRADHHLPSIANRIAEMEAIKMPKWHSLRPRCVWHNDKGCDYMWYIDYMHPHNEKPVWSVIELKKVLLDGWALEDGQILNWDIKIVQYMRHSDHYDKDHYDYYTKYIPNFLTGKNRKEIDLAEYYATKQDVETLEAKAEENRNLMFHQLCVSFNRYPFLKLIRAINSNPHLIKKMERRLNWSSIFNFMSESIDHLFSAEFVFRVYDDSLFHQLVAALPQGEGGFFSTFQGL